MFNYFWIDSWHFLIRPSKNIVKFFEKIYVDLNLLGGAVISDEKILHDAMVSRDIDRYGFNDGFHITLSINFVGS
jgi:hypothetical protein